MVEQALSLAPPSAPRKLDLAAGQNAREGFEGVDRWEGSTHVVDLLRFPWPWGDSSVDELHCSHFIEHIPMEERDGQDLFFGFFDECWRIMKPGATMTAIWPALRSNRAFQDPTHRRFIPAETMLYLNADWRRMNKLDHYRVRCHFGVDTTHTMMAEMGLLHPEAQARRFNESWNTIIDFHAKLVAIK